MIAVITTRWIETLLDLLTILGSGVIMALLAPVLLPLYIRYCEYMNKLFKRKK